MKRAPCVVPDEATEVTIRELYGPDADEVIAFRRFLRLAGPPPKPGGERKIVVPSHWFKYAKGDLTGRQVLELDDEDHRGS